MWPVRNGIKQHYLEVCACLCACTVICTSNVWSSTFYVTPWKVGRLRRERTARTLKWNIYFLSQHEWRFPPAQRCDPETLSVPQAVSHRYSFVPFSLFCPFLYGPLVEITKSANLPIWSLNIFNHSSWSLSHKILIASQNKNIKKYPKLICFSYGTCSSLLNFLNVIVTSIFQYWKYISHISNLYFKLLCVSNSHLFKLCHTWSTIWFFISLSVFLYSHKLIHDRTDQWDSVFTVSFSSITVMETDSDVQKK